MTNVEPRSSIGVYRGYSDEVANGYSRSSVYVEATPGLRLAIDILQPTRDGAALVGPFPVGLIATGYRRAWRKEEVEFGTAVALAGTRDLETGFLVTAYESNGVARRLLHHGYAIAVLDVIGTGASFGPPGGVRYWEQGEQIARVIDWIAEQPWCNGRVGMFGASWLGMNCLVTAAARPEALAAIFPIVPASPYNCLMAAGLLMHGFADDWSDMREGQDGVQLAEPVDGPDGPGLLQEALGERGVQNYLRMSDNEYTLDRFEENVGRQHPALADAETGRLGSVITESERISAGRVPTYLLTGWWDLGFVDDTISLYGSLDVPKRLLVGPWNHSSFSAAVEAHRWFDRWLLDVENGVDTEEPIAFGNWSTAVGSIWRQAASWPVPEAESTTLFLHERGKLAAGEPPSASVQDYEVDYDVTTGLQSRHRHLYRTVEMCFSALEERAKRCAVWLSEPSAASFEIVGAAVLELRLSSSSNAGGLVVVLEELAEDGVAHYVTEGVLNLEDRALATAPFPRPSGVWHPVESSLREAMPVGVPVDVAVELFSVGWRVETGSRLRLTISGADRDNYTIPPESPAPRLAFHQGGPVPSRLRLPVLRGSSKPLDGAFEDEPIVPPFLAP